MNQQNENIDCSRSGERCAESRCNKLSFGNLPEISSQRNRGIYQTLVEMSSGKLLLELSEVAKLLGIDYKVVYKTVTAGKLPANRFNRMWFVSIVDLAGYMERTSNQQKKESSLEILIESLDAADPEDCRFRQELDSYISDRVSQLSDQYSLKEPYALACVVAEVSSLLKGG